MAKIKKIEDFNYYELLDIKKGESQKEIEKAYRFKKATYKSDSLAHYSLLSERERLLMLRKIEEAYKALSDPEKRKLYDFNILKRKDFSEDKVYFRKSIRRLNIEGTKERRGILQRLKGFFSQKRRNRKLYET